MKITSDRPFADPEKAARKLMQIANAAEAVQVGRNYIERINAAFLKAGGSPAEYVSGMDRAIASGWLWRHEKRVNASRRIRDTHSANAFSDWSKSKKALDKRALIAPRTLPDLRGRSAPTWDASS